MWMLLLNESRWGKRYEHPKSILITTTQNNKKADTSQLNTPRGRWGGLAALLHYSHRGGEYASRKPMSSSFSTFGKRELQGAFYVVARGCQVKQKMTQLWRV